eukprot:SAG22_NODE_169_length_16721_cov_6.494104_8_plen_278_part_00
MLLVLALLAQAAAAAPLPLDTASDTAVAAAEQVATAANQLRADATVATALRSVGVRKYEDPTGTKETGRDEPSAAEQALASFGFGTALDLQLLAGGPEAVELMGALRTDSGLCIADRAKVRLLVGDREHLANIFTVSPSAEQGEQTAPQRPRRQLQNQGTSSGDGLSDDSIAIICSVIVGTCGRMMPARWRNSLERVTDKKCKHRPRPGRPWTPFIITILFFRTSPQCYTRVTPPSPRCMGKDSLFCTNSTTTGTCASFHRRPSHCTCKLSRGAGWS